MKKLALAPAVEIAMQSLNPDGVRRLHAWFDYLRCWDEDEEVRKNAVLLDSLPGVYVLRTTTDLRIFFRLNGDTVTVLDVARTPAILQSGGVSAPESSPSIFHPDPTVR